ncbi:hypothetical protein HW561_00875 [Rhodobacteraceae bacterium B1Z28]|uniref:Uncharacterized protein n=1 Tax=Ruegeria haliotis TaxID=2747601 RepID=A0ABX2PJP5_9RHOB|nr:hypothetical protein [Ruegeria haliotis]NVO54340.1 hypothetical protein [Ruegeria haliotis]
MRTGKSGRVAISWTQTELDGLEAAPLASLAVGAAWSWRGQAVMLSEANEQSLEQTGYAGGIATRTSDRFAVVREISGHVTGAVMLTNGAQRFCADLVVDGDEVAPTLVFEGGCPPRDQDFWISEITEIAVLSNADSGRDSTVITFPTQKHAQDMWSMAGRRVAANSPCVID